MKYIMQFLVDDNFNRSLAIKLLEAYGAKHLGTEKFSLLAKQGNEVKQAKQKINRSQPQEIQRASLGRLPRFGSKRRTPNSLRARGVTPHEVILPLLHRYHGLNITNHDVGAALEHAGYSYKSQNNYIRDFVVMGYLERIVPGQYQATPAGLKLRDTKAVDWPSNAALEKAWKLIKGAKARQETEPEQE